MVSDSEHEVIASPISPRSVLSSISSSPSSSSDGEAPAPVPAAGACTTDGLDRVVRNGKIYSKKKANMPYLKGGHTWKEREARQRQRRAVAKESSPPHERTEQVSRSIMRYTVVLVVGSLLLSRMMTESWTFGYTGRWSNYRNWIPRPMHTFSEAELAMYDGSDATKPIYLALDGSVYDVSANPRMYGKGGSYNHFAGRDAARAFVTGCFKQHLTHDTRGLDDKQIKSLQGWKSFFQNHAKYYRVGHVEHAPIDASSPLPPACDPKAEGGAR